MKPTRYLLIAAALALGAGGCSDGPAFGDVQGEVTLDGKPLKEGSVRFVPLDGKTPTASALIKDGAFTARVPVATHRVEFSAPRLPPGITSSDQLAKGTVDENVALEELIPARYNDQSELKAEVKPGNNPLTFPLVSE